MQAIGHVKNVWGNFSNSIAETVPWVPEDFFF